MMTDPFEKHLAALMDPATSLLEGHKLTYFAQDLPRRSARAKKAAAAQRDDENEESAES
jgi:hypothetical protein